MLLLTSFVLILHDELSVPVDVCVHTFPKSLAKTPFLYVMLYVVVILEKKLIFYSVAKM